MSECVTPPRTTKTRSATVPPWLASALVATLTLGSGAWLHAMVVVPAGFSEMVAASQIVVHGRVVDVQSFETAGRRTIETRVTVQVVQAYKGEPGRTVSFRVPGGQVGRYRRVMVGAPAVVLGDEVVLFLKGRAPAAPMPFGLTQGVYRVVRAGDGRTTVTGFVHEGPGRIARGDPDRRPLDLDTFAARVRAIVEARN